MAGVDTFIQVAIDGAGKMVRNFSNLIGGNTVYQQVVTRAKSDGTLMEDEATETTLATVAKDAHLTDGTQKAIARGGAKGTTVAADVTSSASGANHNALDAILYDAAGNVIVPLASGGSVAQGTRGAIANAWPTKLVGSDDATVPVVEALGGDVTPTSVNALWVKGALWGFNGATFDRLRATIANGLAVDVTRVQGSVDVSDKAGRLVGRIYGSQGQQLLQTPTNFNMQVEVAVGAALIDPRSIRALTATDVVTANGDVDHDAVNTLKQVQVAGNARAIDDPPAVVSNAGDRVRAWYDRFGAHVVRPRQIRETYTLAFRLGEAAARLDQTFTQVANTNKQWATLHHTAAATKELKLLKCWAFITSDTVAGIQGIIELRELTVTTPPATGNPAITGRPHRIGTGAHEAVALYLPTTQGSEAAVNSPLGHVPFDTGISGAVSTVNPVPILVPVVLYDAATEDPSAIPPTAPVGVYGGWAVMIRTVGAPVLRVTIFMRITEEIP